MTPNLGTFKYDHGGSVPWGRATWLSGLVIVAVAAAAFAFAPPLGIFALVVLALVWVARLPKRQIRLGVRYAIVGHTIVYFRNVRRMELNPGQDLTLHWGRDHRLKIEQSRFPTNARKDAKIAKNKGAKFEKVSGKIIDRVLHASPTVELRGIDRQAHDAAKLAKAASTGKAEA